MGVGESAGDAYMSHAGVSLSGASPAKRQEPEAVPARPMFPPPQYEQRIYLGRVAGSDHLYLWEKEADAVKFLEDDPARQEKRPNVQHTRVVWQAKLQSIQVLELLPPVPARLGIPGVRK